MNLFRSEESVRSWCRFDKNAEGGIIALDDALELMSGPTFRRRLDSDYMSDGGYLEDFIRDAGRLGRKYPYLSPNAV